MVTTEELQESYDKMERLQHQVAAEKRLKYMDAAKTALLVLVEIAKQLCLKNMLKVEELEED